MFQNILYHWSLVHIKVSSRRVSKKCLGKKFDIVNHKGGHEKQIVCTTIMIII